MKHLGLICLLMLSAISVSFGQSSEMDERFRKADAQISKVSKQAIFHPELIVKALTEDLDNDFDKARALFGWAAINIDYDLYAFQNDIQDGQSVNQVLRSGKALCSGYSLLYTYFADLAGLEAVVVEGYAKGFGYEEGQEFEETNHAWNAIKIDGSWYLLDVTWAAGDPTALARHQKKVDLNTFFLSDPKEFSKTHCLKILPGNY